MDAEWSVECGAEDPVLVVPWSDETGSLKFVDLRQDPYDLDQIREAELHAPMLQALRALNAGRSPVFTAKCDAWLGDPEEVAELKFRLGSDTDEMDHAFLSYVDMIWRERSLFVSFHRHEQLLHGLVRNAEALVLPFAAFDFVLRPALVDLTGPQEGFAVSCYVKGLGDDAAGAYGVWSEALLALVTLVRNGR